MSQLRTLHLARDGFDDFRPPTMPPFLRTLDLSGNNLTSNFDLSFLEDCMNSVEELYLDDNRLSNVTLPDGMDLPNLIVFHASGNTVLHLMKIMHIESLTI